MMTAVYYTHTYEFKPEKRLKFMFYDVRRLYNLCHNENIRNLILNFS